MASYQDDPKICNIPGIKEICKILENAFNNHLPTVDFDHDKFGTESTLRGSSWRGKDCGDFSASIHPGARAIQQDVTVDHNCNGILGVDSSTGRPWEEQFCDDTKRLGIAVLGDSISAHFHIPEQWLDARQFSPAAFEHVGFILENELDWPQMSATTGHVNVSWPNIEGRRERHYSLTHVNRCRIDSIALLSPLRSRSLQPSRLSEHRRQRSAKWCYDGHHEGIGTRSQERHATTRDLLSRWQRRVQRTSGHHRSHDHRR